MSAGLLYELGRGWRGLALAYATVQAPMWVAMARGRAAPERWVASPVLAAPLMLAAGVGMSWAMPALHAAGLGESLREVVGFGLGALFGYAGGHVLAVAPEDPGQRQVRGAVVRAAPSAGTRSKAAARAHSRLRDACIDFGGVAVPAADETRHFKVIGSTGTGKSTAIGELLADALRRGDRAVIADPDGGYLRRFRNEPRGDVILNPFERQGRRWDLFGELTDTYDIDQLALALLPDHAGPERSWRSYARTLFSAVTGQARDAGVTDVGQLYELLVTADRGELKTLVGGTPAQPFFEEHNDRMLDSIRSVLSSAVGALQYVARQDAEPLSVRQWVSNGRGVLFMPYRAGQIAALRSSISAWMRIAVLEAMNRPEQGAPGCVGALWFVIDELDALGPIEGLKDALARLRKFGGRCVLGFQSIAQVSSTYGAGEAQTIVENCGNTLILRCSAGEHGGTSKFASQLIGDREVVRLTRATSRRPGDARVSLTESEHRHVEPAVMASQIERLPDLAGYLKLASCADWLRVNLRRSERVSRPQVPDPSSSAATVRRIHGKFAAAELCRGPLGQSLARGASGPTSGYEHD